MYIYELWDNVAAVCTAVYLLVDVSLQAFVTVDSLGELECDFLDPIRRRGSQVPGQLCQSIMNEIVKYR